MHELFVRMKQRKKVQHCPSRFGIWRTNVATPLGLLSTDVSDDKRSWTLFTLDRKETAYMTAASGLP